MPAERQREKDIQAIKAAVRERDGYRCTKCGVSEADHFAQTGWRLEVHRPVQGPYSMENGVLVCHDCHVKVQKVWGRRMARRTRGS